MAEVLDRLDRTALAAKVVTLRRARGVSGLDGTKFDVTPLVEAEARLAALEDIDAERARRLAVASISEEEHRVAILRHEVGDQYKAFLQHGAAAERAMTDLVAAIRSMKSIGAQIVATANAIKPGLSPSEFGEASIDDRMSRFLSWSLAKLGSAARWGLFTWPGSLEPTTYAAMEKHATAAAIEAIVNPQPEAPALSVAAPTVIDDTEEFGNV